MTHETESALRARILELENANTYLHDVMERAESEANLQIAELRAVNSEQADKIVDLQTRRDEHLRTIADLMGEKAELVEHSGVLERLAKELTSEKMELLNLLRENLETTPAAMDYIQIRLKTKRTLEKHGVK